MGVRIFVLNTKGEILLGFNGQNWNIPGGHVEQESNTEAIFRELEEETGVKQSCILDFERVSPEMAKVIVNNDAKVTVEKDPDAEFSELRFFRLDQLPDLHPLAEPQINETLANHLSVGYIEYESVDGSKFRLSDDTIWDTIPKLAQERLKGPLKRRHIKGGVVTELPSADPTAAIISSLIMEHFPNIDPPKYKFVKDLDCIAKTVVSDDSIEIRINQAIYDPRLLRRILAHELLHCWLHHNMGDLDSDHETSFNKKAASINKIEGKDYIRPFFTKEDM